MNSALLLLATGCQRQVGAGESNLHCQPPSTVNRAEKSNKAARPDLPSTGNISMVFLPSV